MRIIWRSLSAWPAHRTPTAPSDRTAGSAFRASHPDTMDELEHELDTIGAKEVTIEIDMEQRELRRNGEPFASARARTTPGIVLHYTSKDGRAVTMPCDRYHTWQANVRALMLTLRALRAVDRYGATSSGEQYRGWTALPAITMPSMSTAAAARKLVSFAGGRDSESDVLGSAARCRDVLRKAMAATHPDKHMGDVRDFQMVGECKRIMQAHHGVDL
jgi:hypothetical protein